VTFLARLSYGVRSIQLLIPLVSSALLLVNGCATQGLLHPDTAQKKTAALLKLLPLRVAEFPNKRRTSPRPHT
jgi:hypothetical protein